MAMNVIFLSPGFPQEMPFFTRGLAEAGARVIGLGDQPRGALPEMTASHLSAYVQARSFADEQHMVDQARAIASKVGVDRIECMWEPLMVTAARMREAIGVPGLTVEQTLPFRDKELMKLKLDAAGVRTPRHERAVTEAQCRAAAERIGYPLIIKPIAGAGSLDTYRVESDADLESALGLLGHIAEVSVEEFIDADDYTFDTVTAGGEILYYNIGFYVPRPLQMKQAAWISPMTYSMREPESDHVAQGRALGHAVHEALGIETGFTHMEWFRKADGEAIFCEIGHRSPGGRTVDLMNFGSDIDLFRGWGEAVVRGTLSQPVQRRYNVAGVFKRAQGRGIVRRIEGVEHVLGKFGHHVCAIELTPVGRPTRDWRNSTIGDGFVILRHPDLEALRAMADETAISVQLYAE
jgi:hypothetical protein